MTSSYKEQNVLTNLVITNWGKGVLQIGAAFLLQIGANAYYKLGQLFYYKLGQGLLQIRAGITNWGKFITNWGRYYKLGQSLLQIGAGITNWSKLLQIGAQQPKIKCDVIFSKFSNISNFPI